MRADRHSSRIVRVVVGVAVLAGAACSALEPTTDVAAADDNAPLTAGGTAVVERRDLVRTARFDGHLGHDVPTELIAQAPGTLTGLPDAGQVVAPGEVLFEVDEDPVFLLRGATPAWRPLVPGVADGRDIEQLERNLVELGFGDGLAVDEDWSWSTTQAVRAWQKANGLAVTGTLELGRVVFAPEPVRVAEVVAVLGAASDGPVLTVTGVDQLVTTSVHPRDRVLLEEGLAVDVVLPDERVVPARITSIAVGPDADGLFSVTAEVEERIDLPDATPVAVEVEHPVAQDALVVPVTALVALLEGGHAVEVVGDDGRELVGVQLGRSVDGWVQITGAVDAGDTVVTA